jgi:hypothetical protein
VVTRAAINTGAKIFGFAAERITPAKATLVGVYENAQTSITASHRAVAISLVLNVSTQSKFCVALKTSRRLLCWT